MNGSMWCVLCRLLVSSRGGRGGGTVCCSTAAVLERVALRRAGVLGCHALKMGSFSRFSIHTRVNGFEERTEVGAVGGAALRFMVCSYVLFHLRFCASFAFLAFAICCSSRDVAVKRSAPRVRAVELNFGLCGTVSCGRATSLRMLLVSCAIRDLLQAFQRKIPPQPL